MLRIIPSRSAEQAKAYFSDALCKSDYYINDQELQGHFRGRLSARLGISGPATKEGFFNLCENRHPVSGQQLTPRMKDDRITGWDFNWHAPKSVSILHALSGDNHILDAMQASVAETMQDIERDVKTRIRVKGQSADRATGELIWAEFVHQTARPVDSHVPDPHLHVHAFVLNQTFDAVENRHKAAKIREIMRDSAYYNRRFQKRFADRLVELGYQIRRTNNAFEVVGVDKALIEHFSKRTDQIGRAAKEKGITDVNALDALGAKTRSKKQKSLTMAELKADWKRQLQTLTRELNVNQDAPIRFDPVKQAEKINARDAISHALSHCFERASVTDERRVLAESYRHAIGRPDISLDEVTNGFNQDERLLRIKHNEQLLCTTHSILKEEKRMIDLARGGVGTFRPLYTKAPAINLEGQQKDAVNHLLTTPNRVSIVMGAAGVGKTFMMKEAVELIGKAGKKVITVAPTSQASRDVLVKDGFTDAETVAKLLVDKKLQEQLQNQVLWVDEAGLLGIQDTIKILELAKRHNARVIFGGDTRQHSAVVRGDALRILNTVGGIRAAEISTIRRQKDNPAYLAAVQDLAHGNTKSGFEKLDGMNAIKEVDPLKGKDTLVNDYMEAVKKKKSVLVISPTHVEGEAVTASIRERMRSAGKIGKREKQAVRYVNLNLTEAEKSDGRNFQQGQVIQFHQNGKGIKRGSVWQVAEIQGRDIHIKDDGGNTLVLPRHKAKEFSVYRNTVLSLSKGDQVMITQNGFDEKGKRLNNGMMLTVASISKKGKVNLRGKEGKTTYTIAEDFGHINHAYCLTSHASQGKTVDEVFIAQPAATFSATDARQFYVSVSRGKTNVSIYTDDKEALLGAASEAGDRQSALELVSQSEHAKSIDRLQKTIPEIPAKQKERGKDHVHDHRNMDLDYEPGI